LERALSVKQLRMENTRLERQVRERTAELESANKELESFSYSVSHDLQAPLRHVIAFAELLDKELDSTDIPNKKRFLKSILTSANEMTVLIKDLLEFSKMGRTEMQRMQVNLQDLLENVLKSIQPEIEGRNIVWEKGALPIVQADPALLRQVLSNLILNA